MAVNCATSFDPTEMLPGCTVIDCKMAVSTMREAEPLTRSPEGDVAVAEMLAVPADTAVARPVESTVATAGLSELHWKFVKPISLPFESKPFALNCCCVPAGIVCVVG